MYNWGLLAHSHSGVLAVTVLTDRKHYVASFGQSGLKGGCITPIRCVYCGKELRFCNCVPGIDYYGL